MFWFSAYFPRSFDSLLDPKMSYNNFTSKAILQLEDQASKESIRPTWMSPEPSFEQTSVDFDDSDEWAIKVRRTPFCLHFASHSMQVLSTQNHAARRHHVRWAASGEVEGMEMHFVPVMEKALRSTQCAWHSGHQGWPQWRRPGHIQRDRDCQWAWWHCQALVPLQQFVGVQSEFRQLTNEVRKVPYQAWNKQALLHILTAVQIKAKLYTDLNSSVSSVVSIRAGLSSSQSEPSSPDARQKRLILQHCTGMTPLLPIIFAESFHCTHWSRKLSGTCYIYQEFSSPHFRSCAVSPISEHRCGPPWSCWRCLPMR